MERQGTGKCVQHPSCGFAKNVATRSAYHGDINQHVSDPAIDCTRKLDVRDGMLAWPDVEPGSDE